MSRTPQTPKTCTIDGCDGKVKARGWCKRHYDRWHTTGRPEGVNAYGNNKGHDCNVDDCDAPATTRGWCRLHYDRWKRNGDPTIVRRPSPRTSDTESPNVLTGRWVLNPRTRIREYQPPTPTTPTTERRNAA